MPPEIGVVLLVKHLADRLDVESSIAPRSAANHRLHAPRMATERVAARAVPALGAGNGLAGILPVVLPRTGKDVDLVLLAIWNMRQWVHLSASLGCE